MKYTTEIQKAQLDEQGLATVAGWVEVYLCDSVTREYTRASLDNVPFGGSVVADAYLDKPEIPTKSGIAIIRSDDEKSWLQVSDYRGKIAYNTETLQPIEVDFIGELPSNLTLLAPKTEFDVWIGKKWVTDTEAQKAVFVAQAEQEKLQRLDEANSTITYLQDAIEVDLDDDDYHAKLTAWKTYRVLLNRVDTSLAPNIDWPEKPE
ncbi:tail fiber assembly protein [Providencia rettgeri]|uniref:tail fiber assembly protein n=1 Tax=Providencia rettgeri TaxID=587 RepID=UPI001CFAB5E9|nr:tail fiber assembly protein [Providencia rettgeri]EHZ7762716.1 tail fiber assembly protein [Providencia rettgeri]EIJ7165858.1 tail fiber assembly protein [Providencia rettgeri]ELR5089262.1 tail fiber assembly protein [Providencia rettgeri]MCB4812617.1 tail fiber assembly protein [Providencia rettgeri]MCJ2285445.1 tail fiber assembly protein [Providencia rettgeri]